MQVLRLSGRLWRHGDFLKLWTAQAVSDFGARITREGLPMAAVLTMGAKPAELGVLAALTTGPAVIVGLVSAGWVDRLRRRPLLIGADVVRAAILLTIPLAALLHRLSMVQLYLAAALVGGTSVLFDIVDHAYLPGLIPRDCLMEGNGKLGATESLAEIGGPALAGVLFQALTAPFAIAANALTYLISAAFLSGIRQRELEPSAAAVDQRPSWRGDVAAAAAAIAADPRVRPLFLMGLGQSLFGNAFAPLYVVFTIRTLHLTPTMLGATIAVGGVGALAGAILAPGLSARLGLGPTIIAASFGSGAAALLIPLAQGAPPLAMAVLMAAQLFGDSLAVAANVPAVSLRQSVLPPEMLGRTAAVFRASQGAMAVIGAIAGGILGGTVGVRTTLAGAAVGLTLSAAFVLASPLRRRGASR